MLANYLKSAQKKLIELRKRVDTVQSEDLQRWARSDVVAWEHIERELKILIASEREL